MRSTAYRTAAIAILAVLISMTSALAETKPRKPPRGTVSSMAADEPKLVVRIQERIRAKQVVGEFADSLLEQVMFFAWPSDLEIK